MLHSVPETNYNRTLYIDGDTCASYANWQVEGVNKIEIPMLVKLLEPLEQIDWYKLLNKVELPLIILLVLKNHLVFYYLVLGKRAFI